MSASWFIKCVTVGDGTVGTMCMLISYTSNTFPTVNEATMATLEEKQMVISEGTSRTEPWAIKISHFELAVKKISPSVSAEELSLLPLYIVLALMSVTAYMHFRRDYLKHEIGWLQHRSHISREVE